MTPPPSLLQVSVLAMLLAPAVVLCVLSVSALLGRRLDEMAVGVVVRLCFVVALLACATALGDRLANPSASTLLSYGEWLSFRGRAFALDFVVDGTSLGFATLAVGICGTVAAFSFRYLHREPGFHRYFVQLATFTLGILLVALAGSIEVLAAGWELLGLSSVLLVAFFHERRAPVDNALRVLAVYRVGDAAMLGAAVLLHHWAGSGSLTLLFSGAEHSAIQLPSEQVLAITLLIVLAVAAKSALLPFSGWLPRAMEGPTPSSAVYYGALSIHAGCFLLLRAQPLLSDLWLPRLLAGLAGVTTAVYATLTARVQTDAKSALCYAALTQVGIIVVEISIGWTTLAFVHILGNATLRLLQFLSTPNVLHDLHELEDRVGGRVSPARPGGRQLAPRWYLFALERGFADALLDRIAVRPFQWVVDRLDRFDRVLVGASRTDGKSPR